MIAPRACGHGTATAAARLLERFGSPLYVYRTERAAAAIAGLRAALPQPATLYYSLKANPHPDLVQVFGEAGCRAEVSSPGELAAALGAGLAGADCLYTGPAKTADEITGALVAGVRRFSVESAADLDRVARAAASLQVTAECLVRVNAQAAGGSGLRMTGVPSQFGVDLTEVLAEPGRFGDRSGARVVGAHFFPLSNARDEDALIAEMTGSIHGAVRLRDEAGLPLRVVDLGGGFAAPYAAPGQRPLYPRLRTVLEATLDQQLPGWRRSAPEVAFESGRHLVAECGDLICTAIELKQASEKTFLLVDSGINHLGGMSGLGRFLRPAAVPLQPVGGHHGPADDYDDYDGNCDDDYDGNCDGDCDGGSDRVATIVGPLCTTADVLGREVPIGRLGPGDPVVFPNVGAYGLTASLIGFLGRQAPVEVVVCGDRIISASRLELTRTPVTSPTASGIPPT